MVNPVATLVFDVFLVGTAGLVVAAMVQEYLSQRDPCVGVTRRARRTATRPAHPVRKPARHFSPAQPRRRMAA